MSVNTKRYEVYMPNMGNNMGIPGTTTTQEHKEGQGYMGNYLK